MRILAHRLTSWRISAAAFQTIRPECFTKHTADDGRWLTGSLFDKQTTPRVVKPRVSRTKGHLSKRTAFVRVSIYNPGLRALSRESRTCDSALVKTAGSTPRNQLV